MHARMAGYILATAIWLFLAPEALATDGPDKDAKANGIWYVEWQATGTGTGLSWANAFTTIQPAIDAAAGAGGGEVWVAEGAYNEVRDNAAGSLIMRAGVSLYGGFIGLGTGGNETNRSQRNPLAHLSLIDGASARAGQAAYHVVLGADNAVIDGFRITGGNANGDPPTDHGGGMYNDGVSPTIAYCSFVSNSAVFDAAISNANGASPNISNCLFVGNSATVNCGAVGNWGNCQPTISFCIFDSNYADRMGGAILDGNFSSSTITSCIFQNNIGQRIGGAICNYQNGASVIINCLFEGNKVFETGFGGGAVGSWGSHPTIYNSTFVDNYAPYGSGLYTNTSDMVVRNSILWNLDSIEIQGTPDVAYSLTWANYPGEGNLSEDPLFVDEESGDYALRYDSPCVDAGTKAGAPTTDLVGAPRPRGAGVDMGALEFVAATLRGTITDADTNAPIACAAVHLQSSTFERVVVTDLTGRYQAFNLPVDTYLVTVYAPGYETASDAVDARILEYQSFKLHSVSLTDGLEGTVTEIANGEPAVGVRVDASISDVLVATTYSCANGAFAFSGADLAAKTLTKAGGTQVVLDFSGPGYDDSQTTVELVPGGTAKAGATLTAAAIGIGSLAGTVVSLPVPPGVAVANARVTLTGVGAGSLSTLSAANGSFVIPAMPSGRYTVETSAVGYRSSLLSAKVNAFDTATLDVRLSPTSTSPATDIDGNGQVNALDIQLVVNAVLGIDIGVFDPDVNRSDSVNALDIQLVVNGVLGLKSTPSPYLPCTTCNQK